MDTKKRDRDFNSLSLRDLLNARDQYHYHLMDKANVVGTAVGLYLIRDTDPWPDQQRSARQISDAQKGKPKPARTFGNSNVRDYSWPCILVVVKEWIPEEDFVAHAKTDPSEMVPKTLYLPDGRKVPVCVVEAPPAQAGMPPLLPDWHWPEGIYSPGIPVEVEVQKRAHVATVGCLVSDGHTLFALTNQHVTGQAGEPVYTYARGKRVRIGQSSDRFLTRREFSEVYPDFPMRKTWINMDVGLFEVDDVNEWTADLFSIGKVGPLADYAEHNLGMHLINRRVRAHAAASGLMDSEIKALFYRYRSVGGYEYVADYLIASPRDLDAVQTRPGDSGTVWHLMPAEDSGLPQPLAVQWGGQSIQADGGANTFQFALATNLAGVCRLLDVELDHCHNQGAMPYWGQMGHYSIGTLACDTMAAGKCKDLRDKNRDLVGFKLGELDPKKIKAALKAAKDNDGFVPLADVPDIIWKTAKKLGKGGRDTQGTTRTQGPEHPTHYADIDIQITKSGPTLMELTLEDLDNNLSVDVWLDFYQKAGMTASREQGLLPFRVWQFFDAMANAAAEQQLAKFVAAAGLLSHYVGDACQPLHGSKFADGYADRKTKVEVNHRDGTSEMVDSHEGAGVHSAYETAMIDRYSEEIVQGIQAKLQRGRGRALRIETGHDAAAEIVKLMDRTAKKIPPKALVDAYIAAGGTKTVAVQDELWAEFGDRTCEVMADGTRVLAAIWQAAWDKGRGDSIAKASLVRMKPSALKRLYVSPNFVPSLDLKSIKRVLE